MPVISNIEFVVKISNGGNAAFGESSYEAVEEINRIITKAMNTVEKSILSESEVETHFPVRDGNGNRVGFLSMSIEFEDEDEDEQEDLDA